MGDTRERSGAAGLPARCRCGFRGSSETMNLCSKCFADIQEKQTGEEGPAPSSSRPLPSSSSSQSASLFSSESSVSQSCASAPPPSSSSTPSSSSETPSASIEGVSSPSETETGRRTFTPPPKRPREPDGDVTPEKRRRTAADEEEEGEESLGGGGVASAGGGRRSQKSRRRCFRCRTKLELVQQELGSCRCGYVFCLRHRLPEQHDCVFDHLGRGRHDAVNKMVKMERKVGRSCQRIGEDS